MFTKIDSDTQVKILASGHYVPPPHTGAYLTGAMSERVKCPINGNDLANITKEEKHLINK